jgi:HlyD family secretion protein
VHNLAVHTIGGVISPASAILEIIPEDDRLIVEARISPSDIDQLTTGQRTYVRFAAFNQQSTPALEGRLKKVSAAQLTDRATGVQYFSAIIEIDPAEQAKLGAGNHLVPGMPAEVFIETSSRTVLSYFVKPLMDAFQHTFRER